MLRNTFPRSLRAAVALVVMIVCLQQVFTDLQRLIVPTGVHTSTWTVVRLVLALLVGIAATIAFYYFQGTDGRVTQAGDLTILGKYDEAEQRRKRLEATKATPAFPSSDPKNKNSKS